MPGYHVGPMLIKKKSFHKVELFKEDLKLAEVVDWFIWANEMKLHYKMLPEVVMKRRIHTTNQGLYKRHIWTITREFWKLHWTGNVQPKPTPIRLSNDYRVKKNSRN